MQMTLPALRLGAVASLVAFSTFAPAQTAPAHTQSYSATLNAASEVPPNDATGTGTLQATLNTDTGALHWTLTYTGLAAAATAAHFHGPAAAGANAGVALALTNIASSPASGDATLTPAQIADLSSGKWYVNVHTSAHPGGEIRGQITAK